MKIKRLVLAYVKPLLQKLWMEEEKSNQSNVISCFYTFQGGVIRVDIECEEKDELIDILEDYQESKSLSEEEMEIIKKPGPEVEVDGETYLKIVRENWGSGKSYRNFIKFKEIGAKIAIDYFEDNLPKNNQYYQEQHRFAHIFHNQIGTNLLEEGILAARYGISRIGDQVHTTLKELNKMKQQLSRIQPQLNEEEKD